MNIEYINVWKETTVSYWMQTSRNLFAERELSCGQFCQVSRCVIERCTYGIVI